MKNVQRFIYHNTCNLDDLKNTLAYPLMEKLNSKKRLSKLEKQQLTDALDIDGFIKVEGWQFDFRPYLHYYWVMYYYGGIYEHWAITRTYLKNKIGTERIKRIVSLKSTMKFK